MIILHHRFWQCAHSSQNTQQVCDGARPALMFGIFVYPACSFIRHVLLSDTFVYPACSFIRHIRLPGMFVYPTRSLSDTFVYPACSFILHIRLSGMFAYPALRLLNSQPSPSSCMNETCAATEMTSRWQHHTCWFRATERLKRACIAKCSSVL